MTAEEIADTRLREALDASGAHDPRPHLRESLRLLREERPDAWESAVSYYRDTLIPAIAEDARDPLEAWASYALRLAELRHEGRTVSIDRSGRSRAHDGHDPDALVLHLPDAPRERALLVHLPAEPSSAQRAADAWLVEGRNQIPDGG
ncbi:MAG: hypothetical protein RQ745_00075 [Longimicrobiales bacterium]|nr:hypothetical protein [Longimicrobiales bacterium]